jgi:hypothetical protein
MKYSDHRSFWRVLFFVFAVLCLHSVPVYASSGLVITEIMYDPSGSDTNREWVEVYNSGAGDIDLAGHFLLTDGLTSAHHSLVPQGSSVIPAGGYAVIVQDPTGFRGDYPNYSGLMFDSSWTGLTTTAGKTIVVIDPQSAVLDSVNYDPTVGGNNTGDSLQKNASGSLVAAVPTPGAGTASVTVNDTTSGSTIVTTNSMIATTGGIIAGGTPTVVKAPIAPRMRAELKVPATAVTGIPVTISVKVYGTSDELRSVGVTHFALGDGTAHDGRAVESFQYLYPYPGTYVIMLEYRGNPYTKEPEVSSRATIVVSDPVVTISRVTIDGSIELSNPDDSEADLSGWLLAPKDTPFSLSSFHIPSGTILLPGKKILLSHGMTGFSAADATNAALFLPAGVLASTPPAPAQLVVPVVPPSAPEIEAVNYLAPPRPIEPVSISAEKSTPEVAAISESVSTPLPITASAITAVAPVSASSNKNGRSIFIFVVALVVVVALSAFAFYKAGLLSNGASSSEQKESEKMTKLEEEKTPIEDIRILEE